MFGIGGWEFLLIVAVALVVLGPKRLPAAARAVGKVAQQLRKATFDLRRSIELDPQMEDLPRMLDDLGRPVASRPYSSRSERPPPRPDQDFGDLPEGGALEVSSTKKAPRELNEDGPPASNPEVSEETSSKDREESPGDERPASGAEESKDERGEKGH